MIADEQLEKGIIELVSRLDEAQKLYYLPSQTVLRIDAEKQKYG